MKRRQTFTFFSKCVLISELLKWFELSTFHPFIGPFIIVSSVRSSLRNYAPLQTQIPFFIFTQSKPQFHSSYSKLLQRDQCSSRNNSTQQLSYDRVYSYPQTSLFWLLMGDHLLCYLLSYPLTKNFSCYPTRALPKVTKPAPTAWLWRIITYCQGK